AALFFLDCSSLVSVSSTFPDQQLFEPFLGFPGGSAGKESALVQSLGWEDPLEKEMATHSSILAWRIPWPEEPGRLQSTGSQRVGHN
ncbi:hypothetical protein U6L73_11965, partial [Cutibacterium acnes]